MIKIGRVYKVEEKVETRYLKVVGATGNDLVIHCEEIVLSKEYCRFNSHKVTMQSAFSLMERSSEEQWLKAKQKMIKRLS